MVIWLPSVPAESLGKKPAKRWMNFPDVSAGCFRIAGAAVGDARFS